MHSLIKRDQKRHFELIEKIIHGVHVQGIEKDPLESEEQDSHFEQTNQFDYKRRESPFMTQTDKDPMQKTDKTEKLKEDSIKSALDKFRKKKEERKMRE